MLKVGITGGIGSGKTTICKVFEILGVPVFYADEEAKRVMHTDQVLRTGLLQTFGMPSFTEAGDLNRKYIADIVFSNEAELNKLNALVHPAVFRAFDAWAARQVDAPYLLKEAALLFESDSYKMCDLSILVSSPEKMRIDRVMFRDKVTEEQVRLRMARQYTDEQREALADHVLINDESRLLVPQILSLHAQLLKQA